MSDAPEDPSNEAPPPEKGEDAVDHARRLLLKGAVYATPVIVGLLEVRTAKAQGANSCPPATCPPTSCGPFACNPQGGGCGPDFCKPRQ